MYSSITFLVTLSATPGTFNAATLPPSVLAGPLNTENSQSLTISATSTISVAILKSGLSEPYLVIASSQVNTGNLPKSTFTTCLNRPVIISSMIA